MLYIHCILTYHILGKKSLNPSYHIIFTVLTRNLWKCFIYLYFNSIFLGSVRNWIGNDSQMQGKCPMHQIPSPWTYFKQTKKICIPLFVSSNFYYTSYLKLQNSLQENKRFMVTTLQYCFNSSEVYFVIIFLNRVEVMHF